jgi:5-methylcytosine-specific restriction endonuclease McrA
MDHNLTYGELLEHPEWQKTRKAILERDKHICKNCENRIYEKDSFYGPYTINHSSKKLSETFISLQGKTQTIYNKEEKGTLLIPDYERVMLYLSRHKKSGVNDPPQNEYFVAAARFLTASELFYYYPLDNPKLTDAEIDILLHEECQRSKMKKVLPERKDLITIPAKELKWIFAKDLHVHHTYYQIDKLPWQYPDESLQTLCRSCHEKVHDEEVIPVRDANGVKIGSYKPCTRCNGAGGFPEYKHVENGICFQCRGDKYLSEKFIVKD